MTKDRLRQHLSFIRAVDRLPHNPDTQNILDEHKRYIRQVIGQQGADPLALSLRDHLLCEILYSGNPNAWRTYAPERSWDTGWTRYTIARDGAEYTDAEIDKRVESLRITTGRAYDCTGRPFTRALYWKRIPAGVAIIHHISMDV